MKNLKFAQKEFRGEEDLGPMYLLANALPERCIHRADLPYRLSSWGMDDPANVGLWVDENGMLAAWAVMQPPFWTVDMVIHPQAEESLRPVLLDWADQRSKLLEGTPSARPAWFLNLFADDLSAIRAVEAAGYVCQSDKGEDSWSQVLLARPTGVTVPALDLPEGFAIRPLKGREEAQAYVDLHQAVFESKNMSLGWRLNTLKHPDYLPEIDLVITAPDGSLAGFCIGWLNRREPAGAPSAQIEPMGVSAAYRGLGLGKALLCENLHRMAALGAEIVYVETDNYRDAAYKLYHSAGFEKLRDILVFRKE